MKRKFVCIVLVLLVVLSFSVNPVIAGGEPSSVKVMLNNNYVNFGDQVPYTDRVTGRIMLPLRTTTELMGASVSWDGKDTAIIKKDGTTITMQVGSKCPIVNGVTKYLDVAAVVVNEKLMVPVRFVSEALGATVTWDSANQIVNICTNGVVPIPPVVQAAPPETNTGGLPNEDLIQKELTQEDIVRLQSYPVSEKVRNQLQKYPEDVQATFGINFGTFDKSSTAPLFKALNIFQGICNFDFSKCESSAYKQEYIKKYCSITGSFKEPVINKYVYDSVKNKLKNKAYVLSSENLIYQALPGNIYAVRIKYIFYQESGTKIEEAGATLGKWYWRDIELLLGTPPSPWEGNTTGVVYIDFINLSAPQIYNFN